MNISYFCSWTNALIPIRIFIKLQPQWGRVCSQTRESRLVTVVCWIRTRTCLEDTTTSQFVGSPQSCVANPKANLQRDWESTWPPHGRQSTWKTTTCMIFWHQRSLPLLQTIWRNITAAKDKCNVPEMRTAVQLYGKRTKHEQISIDPQGKCTLNDLHLWVFSC